MNRPVPQGKQANVKVNARPKTKAKPRSARKTTRKAATLKFSGISLKHRLLLMGLEALGLVITAVSVIMFMLGYSANWFSGTGFFASLLPFAIGVLGLIVIAAVLLIGWWKLRGWLHGRSYLWAPMVSMSFALVMGWFVMQNNFTQAFGHFRTLVGGKHEVSRVTLAHQVYAAYRRYDSAQLKKLVERAQEFNPVIDEAARTFGIDASLLKGLAATESSFMPRDSADGGHGLFQITRVPKAAMEQAGRYLRVSNPSLANSRHNAFIAAATLKYYLEEMNNDLFLGLLAYNIGPANGGLRFIMQQYGVTDFITIQPYLQKLPRDYPIRVLSYSLAFRLWRKEGKLLPYEEGENAVRIQHIGIPGLHL